MNWKEICSLPKNVLVYTYLCMFSASYFSCFDKKTITTISLGAYEVFSILLVSTKKWYSSFLKKVFLFQKICFKGKVLKTFETFTDCHIKTCRSLKRRAILKIPSTVFWKNLCPFGFKMNALRKSVFEC